MNEMMADDGPVPMDLGKCRQLKNDSVQAFDTKWDDVLLFLAVTDRPTDSILESLYKRQLEKLGRIEICDASLRWRDYMWRPDISLLQIEVDGPKTSRAEHQRFSIQSEKSRRGQTCNRSSEQR